MSIFDNHINETLPTEIILRYACEEYKKSVGGESPIFKTWDALHSHIISYWEGGCWDEHTKRIVIHFLLMGQAQYQKETGKQFVRKFEYYHFDEPNYLEGKIKNMFYESV